MSETELFSLRPLISFQSLISSKKNKHTFNIDNIDDFEILSWTAGGRFDGREFVVIACKSKSGSQPSQPLYPKSPQSSQPPQSPQSQPTQTPQSPQSEPAQQQYLIIRSVNALPQKLRSKHRRRSKRKHAKLVKDSHIQHLYGDTYHIDIEDTDANPTPQNDTDIEEQSQSDGDSDGIHSVSSIDSMPPDIQNFGKNFGPINGTQNSIDYSEYEELPVLRIIAWFKHRANDINSVFDKTIVSMDFNPSGQWLMVICADCSVYLLPLRNLLEIPTHQLELSVTTAYELNNAHNKSSDEFFEQQFGFVNHSNEVKRGGMIRNNALELDANVENVKRRKGRDVSSKIGSTSLAHLVLHRGKSNKTKSKKGWGSTWFGGKSRNGHNADASFSFKNMSPGNIRQGSDNSEQLENAVCADGSENFGAQHDLTIISHGILRKYGDTKHKNVCANYALWWTTRAKKDFIIFGSNDGRLCLLNVRSHNKVWIEVSNNTELNIVSFELIIDIKSSSLLIHCSDNIYYILLLERPFKKNRDSHQSLHGALNAQMSQELLMAGYLLNSNQNNEDPSKITQWDTVIECHTNAAFKPLELNLGNDDLTLSVYHNTGSVIADPHQQTPTPSEKAARMLGLPYPRRRIVAKDRNMSQNQNNGLSSLGGSMANINEDPLRTEHAQSCVHFGVFYNKQSKLALHALDEIYQPPRAGFKIEPSLRNVFAHNFIISLAPNGEYNQINIIAPPLASLMGNIAMNDSDDDSENEEIILSSNSSATKSAQSMDDSVSNVSIQRTQDMLSDISSEDDLKMALMRHNERNTNANMNNKSYDRYAGIVQKLYLDSDERVVGILDRTTSVIMSSPKIYIERLDPLEIGQLNKDAAHAFDVTITPTMSKSEIPYGATHSVWSSLKSPYLLLLTNKAVYQIDKVFDGFSTVLESVEKNTLNQSFDHHKHSQIINGLAQCCEVNNKSIHEIAADRMLAHNSKIRDAEIAFELYSQSSVTVAKLIRQFLRPEWLHDSKHDLICNKIFGILKRLLTTADIPSRITFSDIMFNLLLLQYHIHHPFMTITEGIHKNESKESEAQLRRRKLIHFVSLNRECSLKMVIGKLLNICSLDLALHVLQSHDHPKSIGSNANLPIGSGPAVAIAQAAALKQAQSNISLNVTGNLTDFFLSLTSKLGINLNSDTSSFLINNYPLLCLEKKLDLNTIPTQFWSDIIFQMLDSVVKLCENSASAQRYYQTQQLFRQRKLQQNYHEQYVEEVKQEELERENNSMATNNEEVKQEELEKESESIAIQSNTAKLPKSFEEETRMRQKQVVSYLSNNLKLFNKTQLITIHSYLTKLTANIFEKFYSQNSNNHNSFENDSFDALSWSTPGWLLLHLKVLLRIRFIDSECWDKFGNDQFCKEFEVFLSDVLTKFTGMLDITLVLDEILKYNDLPIAMLLHGKLDNSHDYICTFCRFLLYEKQMKLLCAEQEYRTIVLQKIVTKLLLLKPSTNLNIINTNINIQSHAQGRCLAHLIALWMKLELPLIEIECVCIDNFDHLRYGLNNLLFHNWANHQTHFDNDNMPQFSPKLMLKITQFALEL